MPRASKKSSTNELSARDHELKPFLNYNIINYKNIQLDKNRRKNNSHEFPIKDNYRKNNKEMTLP